MMYSLRPLNYLHGKTPVKDFGPSALKAVRELMIHGYEHPKYGPQEPLCRSEINKRVKRIRRMMKWGTENEIVPRSVLLALPSGDRVRLEALRLGSRWITSREALQRFAERLTPNLENKVPQSRTPTKRDKLQSRCVAAVHRTFRN